MAADVNPIDGDSKFYVILLSLNIPSNYNHCKLYKILIIFNGVSNDNEIT
jgi:hypothetical protein